MRTPKKYLSVSCVLHCHVSCIVAVPRLQLLKTGCALHLREVPSCLSQLCLLLSWTAVASISHLCISLSGTGNTGREGYSSPPLCFFPYCYSLFPLWSLSAPIIHPCFKVRSNLEFICSHYSLLFLSPAPPLVMVSRVKQLARVQCGAELSEQTVF